MKKIIALIIILILFLGCTEKTIKEPKEYSIKLIDATAEENKINLEIQSKEELSKTRIEILNENQKLACFEYFELSKGNNKISIYCSGIEQKKINIKITPSDGKTIEFEKEIKAVKLVLEKGFNYLFKLKVFETGQEVNYDLFVLDENKEFYKIMINLSTEDLNYYNFMLIDKNSLKIHSSGTKNDCNQAIQAEPEDSFNPNEFDFVMPVIMLYYQNLEGFNLKEFIEKKEFTYTKEKQITFKLKEKKLFNLIEVFKGIHSVEKAKDSPEFYLQADYPHMLLYYESLNHYFKYLGKQKEEFNKENNGCLNAGKNN